MSRILDLIRAFARGMSRSRVSMTGAILVTILFPALVVSTLLDILGAIENPYFGFVIYLIMGPLFILGLVLIVIGLLFFRRPEADGPFSFEYLREQFASEDRFGRVRKIAGLIFFLTLLNVILVALFSYTGFHYTESVEFCGRFCHSVMKPEYTAFQNSPHSRVSCVECHIGSGAKWYAKSKLSGARQFLAVAFNTYNRPIETPVRGLRPARETCEECHRPELFVGEKLRIKHKFLPDEKNTHVQTVLMMKIGSGGGGGHDAHGIHWHVSGQNEIRYRHADEAREEIYEVHLMRADGSEKTFSNGEQPEAGRESGETHRERTLDCVDCHNRPTHIYLSAEDALNKKFYTRQIPRELPFIKRQALNAVQKSYKSTEEALEGIATELRGWYSEHYPELVNTQPKLLEHGIKGVLAAYSENVYPEMRIKWDTYKSFLGHPGFEGGCFRCHDDSHETEDGEVISMDCDTCHVVLAEEEEDPEILRLLSGE